MIKLSNMFRNKPNVVRSGEALIPINTEELNKKRAYQDLSHRCVPSRDNDRGEEVYSDHQSAHIELH